MSRTCSICSDDRRDAIDLALVSGGATSKIAALYRVSYDALLRHRSAHLPGTLLRAREAEWLAVRAALLRALAGHPDARRAVVDALTTLEILEQEETSPNNP